MHCLFCFNDIECKPIVGLQSTAIHSIEFANLSKNTFLYSVCTILIVGSCTSIYHVHIYIHNVSIYRPKSTHRNKTIPENWVWNWDALRVVKVCQSHKKCLVLSGENRSHSVFTIWIWNNCSESSDINLYRQKQPRSK